MAEIHPVVMEKIEFECQETLLFDLLAFLVYQGSNAEKNIVCLCKNFSKLAAVDSPFGRNTPVVFEKY